MLVWLSRRIWSNWVEIWWGFVGICDASFPTATPSGCRCRRCICKARWTYSPTTALVEVEVKKLVFLRGRWKVNSFRVKKLESLFCPHLNTKCSLRKVVLGLSVSVCASNLPYRGDVLNASTFCWFNNEGPQSTQTLELHLSQGNPCPPALGTDRCRFSRQGTCPPWSGTVLKHLGAGKKPRAADEKHMMQWQSTGKENMMIHIIS